MSACVSVTPLRFVAVQAACYLSCLYYIQTKTRIRVVARTVFNGFASMFCLQRTLFRSLSLIVKKSVELRVSVGVVGLPEGRQRAMLCLCG